MLAEDELRATLADCMWHPRLGGAPGWIADFLGLPPLGGAATFTDELDQLMAWDDDRIRAEICQPGAAPLPAVLGRPGLREALASILRWVWTTTLVPDWPRRRRVLEADIVTRTSRLASHGWAGVFSTLSWRTSWLGDGRLQINGHELPDRDLSQARELNFVPVHCCYGWDGRDLPHRYMLVYPAGGVLAATDGAGKGMDGLSRLVGANRGPGPAASRGATVDDPARGAHRPAAWSGQQPSEGAALRRCGAAPAGRTRGPVLAHAPR